MLQTWMKLLHIKWKKPGHIFCDPIREMSQTDNCMEPESSSVIASVWEWVGRNSEWQLLGTKLLFLNILKLINA